MHPHRATRWEAVEDRGYGPRFAEMQIDGTDITGEARLADVLAPRTARILDAGSGMGRIGAALQGRGHDVVGVDLDTVLLRQSRTTYPHLPVLEARLDELTAATLTVEGHPAEFDLIVCVGNVMILLAPDTEREVLTRLSNVLATDGRMLVGFHLEADPTGSRTYPAAEFRADAATCGLRVEAQFASYDLVPASNNDEYAVFLLRHA